VISRLSRRCGWKPYPYEIPFALLPNFKLTEDAVSHEIPGAFQQESIVDVFQRNSVKMSWQFTALGLQNGNDRDRLHAVASSFQQHADIYMLYQGVLDGVGHESGPESDEVCCAAEKLSHEIEDLVERFLVYEQEIILFVLGDHGMAPVRQAADVCGAKNALTALELVEYRDYEMFVDSIYVRLWGKTSRFSDLRNAIRDRVGKVLEYGDWLDYSWLDVETYGDMIWAADQGCICVPDYFHGSHMCKGMHGYAPTASQMAGSAIVTRIGRNGPVKGKLTRHIEQGNLTDIAPTLASLFDVPVPASSEGESWF
jgi:predicted AlkP superfamily pyrophosphatase or phosphodiesterase